MVSSCRGPLALATRLALACAVAAACGAAQAQAADTVRVRGSVGIEALRLPSFEGEEGGVRFGNPQQPRENIAFRGQLEVSGKFNDNWSAAARAFVREDVRNNDRDSSRLDEAWLQYATRQWDVRVGNQLVTWGSVESVSPLDVINPRDYEEDIVEPIKIGLGMARARLRLEDAELGLYWLPSYKPSRYAGPRSYYAIGGGLPNVYPNDHWDADQWAVRYFRSESGFDVGLSFLHALERNASFHADPTGTQLVGSTYRSNRLGTDITYVNDELVLKLEAVLRTSRQSGNRRALLYALGAEYTLTSIWEHSDLTFFVELLGASRNVRRIELMQNEFFAALRWSFNDRLKQRLQIGTFQDLDKANSYVWRIEHQVSPVENVDVGARYTVTRNYYPSPRHVESDTGVFHFFVRYNF